MKTAKSIGTLSLVMIFALSSCESNRNRNDNDEGPDKITIEKEKTHEGANVELNTEENEGLSDAEMEKQREEFRTSSEARIDENDRRIHDLDTKIEESNEKMKKEYRKRIAELKERNARYKARLKESNETNKAKWDEFKREFNHDMDELGKALEEFTIDNKK